ncbi:MAG: glycosyltransferase [Patulibacter sp.]
MTGSEAPDPIRVCVVAEFYPRANDPVLGVWAHEQAKAARDAGADVRVLVLHRPVPPRATRPRDLWRTLRTMRAQPRDAVLDGIPVRYVRFYSPPRGSSYGSWGRWASRPLARALRALHREFPFALIHAHNAVPAGDAVRRVVAKGGALGDVPWLVSVHGGDVYFTAQRSPDGKHAVQATFAAADRVLANSRGTAERCAALDAVDPSVVQLGTDLPEASDIERWQEARAWPDRLEDHEDRRGSDRTSDDAPGPTLVTIAHLVPRKRHEDVLRALWLLRARYPRLRYRVIGSGPHESKLRRLADELGVADRVDWRGQLPHREALAAARDADLFVMPSIDEAFGVAYIEAMAAAMPAIASLGEAGPTEIADAGDGITLVPPGDVEALAEALDGLLDDPKIRRSQGASARATVAASFTWDRCGAATVAAYRDAIATRAAAGRAR